MNTISAEKSSQRIFGGFTIVELLIVIGIIGIVAAIAMIGYRGVVPNTVNKQLMSDLDIARDQLDLYFTDNGLYPQTLADADNGNGVKVTADTILQYSTSPNRMAYCLNASSAKSGTGTFNVTQKTVVASGSCTTPANPTDVTVPVAGEE